MQDGKMHDWKVTNESASLYGFITAPSTDWVSIPAVLRTGLMWRRTRRFFTTAVVT